MATAVLDAETRPARPTPLKLAPPDVVEFLFMEAQLLNDRRFEEWLVLFTEDGYEWVPASLDQTSKVEHISLFYDDMDKLTYRIRRLRHPAIHSQIPHPNATRLLSNIVIEEDGGKTGETVVRACFIMVEARLVPVEEYRQRIFGGYYRYRLVPSSEGWMIRGKEAYLMNCQDFHSNLGLPF